MKPCRFDSDRLLCAKGFPQAQQEIKGKGKRKQQHLEQLTVQAAKHTQRELGEDAKLKLEQLMAGKSKDEVKGSQEKGKAMDLQCGILFMCVYMFFHIQTRENALIVQSTLRQSGMRLGRDTKSSFVATHGRRGDRKSLQLPPGGSNNTW